VELQVHKEADGVRGHVRDRGRALWAWESGDAGADGGLFIEGVSGDAVGIMIREAGSSWSCLFLFEIYIFGIGENIQGFHICSRLVAIHGAWLSCICIPSRTHLFIISTINQIFFAQ
jgi:hypothetical protein